jgi:hypothetical protein
MRAIVAYRVLWRDRWERQQKQLKGRRGGRQEYGTTDGRR